MAVLVNVTTFRSHLRGSLRLDSRERGDARHAAEPVCCWPTFAPRLDAAAAEGAEPPVEAEPGARSYYAGPDPGLATNCFIGG